MSAPSTSDLIRDALRLSGEPMTAGQLVEALDIENRPERVRFYKHLSSVAHQGLGVERLDDGRYSLIPGWEPKRGKAPAHLRLGVERLDRPAPAPDAERPGRNPDAPAAPKPAPPPSPPPAAAKPRRIPELPPPAPTDKDHQVVILSAAVNALVDIILEAGIPLGDEGRKTIRDAIRVAA